MNKNEEQYELTEQYLAGLLSGQELSDYEKMMAEDPELKLYTEKAKQINELVFSEGLRTDFSKIKEAEKAFLRKQKINYYGKWLGASGVVLLGGYLIWSLTTSENSGLAKSDSSEITIGAKTGTNSVPKTESTITTTEISKSPKQQSTITNKIVVTPSLPDQEKKNDTIIVHQYKPRKEIIVEEIKTVITPPVVPCEGTISAVFEAIAGCEHKNESSIHLRSVLGGTAPYWVSINNKDFRQTSSIQFLSAGNYQLVVKDNKGCKSSTYTISVEEKSCMPKEQHSVFSYQNTAEWVFPETGEENFSVEILNSAGASIFSTQVVGGMPSSWNGYANDGRRLPTGLYVYRFIKNGTIFSQGTITVVD